MLTIILALMFLPTSDVLPLVAAQPVIVKPNDAAVADSTNAQIKAAVVEAIANSQKLETSQQLETLKTWLAFAGLCVTSIVAVITVRLQGVAKEIHTAVNSERTAMQATLAKMHEVILNLEKDKSANEQRTIESNMATR